jgi:hypothetical protein
MIAGCRITQWNTVRLHRRGRAYVISRNLEPIGTYERLEKALDAFERVTNGAS